MGESDLALAEIRRHLRDFIGMHTWEELCREWTLRAGVRGEIGMAADQVGSVWTRSAQVDVVGINSMDKTIVLGECKWQDKSVGRRVLQELVDKTGDIVPKQGQWHVHYLGFARQGWSDAARSFAADAAKLSSVESANWQAKGMQLVDLAQVDADLHSWVRR